MSPARPVALTLASAAAACLAAGCGGDAPHGSVVGLFASKHSEFVSEVEGGKLRLSMPFQRVEAMPDTGSMPECPDFGVDYPVELTVAYPSVSEAFARLDRTTTLGFDRSSEIQAVTVLDFEAHYRCCILEVGQDEGGRTLVDGNEQRYGYVLDKSGEQLTLTTEVGAPVLQTPEPSLLETSAEFDWLYGTWTMDAFPDNRIELGADRLTRIFARQVGTEGDPAIPYPTLCVVRLTTERFVLTERSADDTGSHLWIEEDAGEIELVDDARNDAACFEYVAREQARMGGRAADRVWRVEQTSEGRLLVDGAELFSRQEDG